jgi:hypothetical protein
MNKTSVDTKGLLSDIETLEARKADAIRELLDERADLEKSTEDRLKAIATELQSLGHKRTRAPKGSKAAK